MEQLLKVADVAQVLQVSKLTAWKWISNGRIESYRVNKQYRVSREQLEQFLKGGAATE